MFVYSFLSWKKLPALWINWEFHAKILVMKLENARKWNGISEL